MSAPEGSTWAQQGSECSRQTSIWSDMLAIWLETETDQFRQDGYTQGEPVGTGSPQIYLRCAGKREGGLHLQERGKGGPIWRSPDGTGWEGLCTQGVEELPTRKRQQLT